VKGDRRDEDLFSDKGRGEIGVPRARKGEYARGNKRKRTLYLSKGK